MALIPALAAADVHPKFAKLRDAAEPLGGLGQFIDGYVGDCLSAAMGGSECQQNAAAFRQKATGKKYFMIITEDAASMIQMGTYNPRGEFTLNVTPFFAAAGSALTHGAPSRTDGNGNPVLPFLTVKGTIPEGGNASTISRMTTMRVLRLQVVFTPQGLWTLPKKGGGKITGVKAKIEAILVTVGRTGEQIGLWTAR
ncbi:MAG: DUF6066 family protein [Myxococcaceae bacterium]